MERTVDNPDEREAEEAFGGPVRRCPACHEWLPADMEFWKRQRDRTVPWLCRVCEMEGGQAIEPQGDI